MADQYVMRFDEHGHSHLWCPYHPAFIKELKMSFNSNGCIGAEWNKILKCWIIYTGWQGSEEWITELKLLLDKFYPGKF